jgi:hypothetical protein
MNATPPLSIATATLVQGSRLLQRLQSERDARARFRSVYARAGEHCAARDCGPGKTPDDRPMPSRANLSRATPSASTFASSVRRALEPRSTGLIASAILSDAGPPYARVSVGTRVCRLPRRATLERARAPRRSHCPRGSASPQTAYIEILSVRQSSEREVRGGGKK